MTGKRWGEVYYSRNSKIAKDRRGEEDIGRKEKRMDDERSQQ